MAEKSPQLIAEALTRAAGNLYGLPLHGNAKRPGIFPATAIARQAAERCKAEGYLRLLDGDAGGKTRTEVYTISDKGLAYLLRHASPKQILEELVQTLDRQHGQVRELIGVAEKWQKAISNLQNHVERVLEDIKTPLNGAIDCSANGSVAWPEVAVGYLVAQRDSRTARDCPLPDLYRQATRVAPHLTVGHFHDGIRRLHQEQKVYLHPWTGPLYEMPEPLFALLIGHEIAYYASAR